MAATTAIRNIGKVVQVIGPVLDVEFEAEHLPELYNALEVTAKTATGEDIHVVVVGGETNGYWRIMGCNYQKTVSVDEWR